ncbi:helix-turn-helix domain-containing protein [uncultured Enterococcus sp.]|uniref:helix-turn-helix domain-containing protein n=1 Tax=uncultured Enterococcus sp. TaxID=167972 RepID=UPI002AA6E583|nr:helix-turn-helix domain-containing protein [uncultured Enterococcus sp.]
MAIFNKNALSNFFGLYGEDDYDDRYDSYETIFKSFGSLLKAIRLEKDLTTSELSQKSSISQSYISQLENNVRLPSDKIIEKLAYGLIGKDFSELTEAAKQMEHFPLSSEEERRLFRETVQYLKEARDYMKIKDIPSILSQDDLSSPLTLDERELLRNFSLLTNEGKDRLLSYLNFLLNDSK